MLTDTDIADMLTAAVESVPNEMCGLLFRAKGFYLATNIADDPSHQFELAHEEFLSAIRDHGGEVPWAIVHSHPVSSAHMSPKDCLLLDAFAVIEAPMQMVIVGLKPREIRIYEKHGSI